MTIEQAKQLADELFGESNRNKAYDMIFEIENKAREPLVQQIEDLREVAKHVSRSLLLKDKWPELVTLANAALIEE